MARHVGRSSEFESYPFLSGEEFAEVCHHLDSKYCRATLGPARQHWRLRTCTALSTYFAPDTENSTYIQIVRPLDGELDDGGLASELGKFAFAPEGFLDDGPMDEDREMVEAEEADDSVVRGGPSKPAVGYVTYEIHLHPTYRGPCLWFTLHGLPAGEPAFDIDTVFRRLVPDQYKEGLRAAGAIGGISADHHPITGVPSFFVHPCLLGEAMSRFVCSKENYLMVWLGLVGGCVGLWVPKEMALDTQGPG